MNVSTRPSEATLPLAWQTLEAVPDPEIPVVSIRELGILRDVRLAGDGAARTFEIVITPTYSGCPAMDQIAQDIDTAMTQAGLGPYRITTVLAPAWTTDWITDEARDKLRAYGIAPPTGAHAVVGGGAVPVKFYGRPKDGVACPQCGSHDTEVVSAFGSTACKALYRCRTCREPFDFFKPY
ncbi:Putative 1,2-phenylacetyl-CoA epoxidase, subunit D [Pandoraea terrae]|uniref:1,2-phenylacetyl-CoA epoxidase, subunit D n=1 Tax=Pandoraea terrae TaxID=1537710 RepID=A0A5E4YAT7_9BURK|nr:1,2-phenylacetyl-CoA epoxidase subunit PaaD [Pandoraea terrae]VVE45562.1 Putative 1,2-phenylacetyl-CoA epoxidase, subunit D [Pandoraea terrae]